MKYKALGKLIRSEREKRGWEQADLAKRLNVTQQTVSRWEKGDSRPKQDDVSKLADLFSGEKYLWFTRAGYEFDEPDVSLAPYLPLQNLSAEKFELFCRDFVQALTPNANVHRYGPSGYKQEGIDLYAQTSRSKLDFQCKRHKQFGAAKIRAAIKKTTLKANRHHLLLSRTATPLARKEIQKHRNWKLWDREDISAKLRSLPNDEKIRLVDIYFPGKRKSFLGIDDPSPWLTTEDYFLPLANKLNLFSHGWQFVGRIKELEQLEEFTNQSTIQAILISGRGGIGKSRLLKAWADIVGKSRNIRFVSSGSDVDAQSLESLPTGPAVLVIDDAHDRSDILVILNGVARTRPEMKVLISSRPYGISYLKEDLAKSGLTYDLERTILLNDLTIEDAKTLSEEILADSSVNGNILYAPRIAAITKDCPLATVIGSRLVGQGAIKPEVLNNDEKFREELLNGFRAVIAGEVGGVNTEEVSDLLNLLATVQPLDPLDPKFQRSAETILGRPFDKILRHISLLEDSGVLLRRGNRLRVVPDLLSDYIRARAAYYEKNQKPTGYADRVFEKLQDELATNLLVNISQLDWRISAGGVRASLLDEVWSKLKEQFRQAKIFERVAILEAMKKVSYFQPGHALDFIRLALAEPTDEVEAGAMGFAYTKPSYQLVLEKIPAVLRYVAYNLDHLTEVLDLLKELAEKDSRLTNPNPDHPIRVLQDIAAIEPRKPLAFNNIVADHAIGWLKQPQTSNFSPFDVLDEMLKTDGHETESKGFVLTLRPFVVNLEAVSALRERIVEEALATVQNAPLNHAIRALKTITAALSYPHGISVDTRTAWDSGILIVLDKLINVVMDPKIDPYIAVEIRRSVSWHVTYGGNNTKTTARAVLKAIPETLDHELSRAIADGWGWTFERHQGSWEQSQATLIDWRKKLIDKLLKKYKGKLPSLIKLLERRIDILNSAQMTHNPDAGPFLGAVMEVSKEFNALLGEYLLSNPSSSLLGWFGGVVSAMAKHDRSTSLKLARSALKKDEPILSRSVAWALGWGLHNVEVIPEEIDIIRDIANSKDAWTRHNIVRAVERFPQESKSTALDILLSIDITDSKETADEVLGEFEEHGAFKIDDLTNEQIQRVLNNLVKCSSINDYHISLFLSKTSFSHPSQTLKMFMDRVEYKEKNEKAKDYDPLPYSWRESEALRFHDTASYEQLLRTVRDWATENTGNWVRSHYGADLFKLVSSGFNRVSLKVLEEWMMSADSHHLEKVASLLSEANNTFVWDNQEFVVNILEQAQKYGGSCYKRVSSSLHTSVFQGARTGTPGQPFPEDIAQRDRSLEMISKLPVGSPAYLFYKMLYEEAKTEIKRRSYDEIEYEDMWN